MPVAVSGCFFCFDLWQLFFLCTPFEFLSVHLKYNGKSTGDITPKSLWEPGEIMSAPPKLRGQQLKREWLEEAERRGNGSWPIFYAQLSNIPKRCVLNVLKGTTLKSFSATHSLLRPAWETYFGLSELSCLNKGTCTWKYMKLQMVWTHSWPGTLVLSCEVYQMFFPLHNSTMGRNVADPLLTSYREIIITSER